jgi:DNA-binding NtrC family response regulator
MSQKPKMLVVDDEPHILESLTQLFDTEFHVLTASDGQTALMLLQHHPDVAIVISDQRMPGMKGVELLRHVKQLVPHSMRILLTGYADLEAVLDSVNVGEVFRYVRKPWVPETLRSIVALAMATYVLRSQNAGRSVPKVSSVSGASSASSPRHNRYELGATSSPDTLPTSDPLLQRRATDRPQALSFEEEFFAHHNIYASPASPPPEKTVESLEEEFFEAFRQEAIAALKKFESFEEEFFAKLNAHVAHLDPSQHSCVSQSFLYTPSATFEKSFYGRSGKPRILILDDDARVLRAPSELLCNDYDILSCISPYTALDILEQSSFVACIFTDMHASHSSSTSFLKDAHAIAPFIPKILMTATVNQKELTSLVHQGLLFRYIEKPWDVSKLSAALADAVEVCRHNMASGIVPQSVAPYSTKL